MKYLVGGIVLFSVLTGCDSTRLYRLESEIRQNLHNINESILVLAEEVYYIKRKLRVMKRRK